MLDAALDMMAVPRAAWRRLMVADRAVLARPGPTGPTRIVPLRAALGPIDRLSLNLTLTRQPTIADLSLASLILQGQLRLPLSLAVPIPPALRETFASAFLPSIRMALTLDGAVLAVASGAGADASLVLAATLSPSATRAVLAAFSDTGDGPMIEVTAVTADAPGFEPVSLATLLKGMDASARVKVSVPDGSAVADPLRLYRGLPTGTGRRGTEPAALPMVARGLNAVAMPILLTPNLAAQSSAASVIATHATGDAIQLAPNRASYLAGDLVVSPAYAASPNLPLVDDPSAALWSTASGGDAFWYAPGFKLVSPGVADDPDSAAFAVIVTGAGPVLSRGGGVTQGLSALIRLTLAVGPTAETTAASTAIARAHRLLQVPLSGLSVALELQYRASGTAAPLIQRLPTTVRFDGARAICTLTVLDDWARLIYAALAGLRQGDLPTVSLVVSYGFKAATPIDDRRVRMVSGGKIVGLAVANDRTDLALTRSAPVLVASERAVVSGDTILTFPQERAGATAMRAAAAIAARPTYVVATAAASRIDLAPRPQVVRPDIARPDIIRPVDPPIFRPRYGIQSVMRQHVIAAAFPCNTFGSLYLQVDDADGHRHAIGCQDALRLGESAARPFEELPELRQPDYQVWRSLQQPGRFLVQPTAFRVARYAASHPTFAFRPVMMLYGTLTDTPGMDRYTLSATLIADVSPARLSLLRAALVAFSPAGVTPEIFWPTDPSVGAATAATWLVPGSAPPPQSLVVVDGVTVSFTTAGADALLLTAMIGHGGVTGALSFALSDGTRLDSALLLDGLTAGPPDTGPVTVTIAGATATLTNRTGQPMNVFGLALIGPGGAMPAAAGLTLAPGATADVPIPAGATTALADARPASAASIQELDIFVEDVTQTVQFINQIVFSNHAITTLRVAARIAGTTHEEASDLAEGAVITLSFTLPITAYLAPRGLEFAITRTDATGTHTTPWQSRDLTTGSVVGVTFDMT